MESTPCPTKGTHNSTPLSRRVGNPRAESHPGDLTISFVTVLITTEEAATALLFFPTCVWEVWITSTYHLQLPTKVNTTSVADHSSSNNNYKKQCTSHKHCSNAGDWVSSCDTIQTVNGSVVYSKVCNIVSLWSMTNLSSLGCHPIFPQCDWIHN